MAKCGNEQCDDITPATATTTTTTTTARKTTAKTFTQGICFHEYEDVYCIWFSVVELRGGSSECEGNVFVNGQPVCDDYWDKKDATVVCRMLGYFVLFLTSSWTHLMTDFHLGNQQLGQDLEECLDNFPWMM